MQEQRKNYNKIKSKEQSFDIYGIAKQIQYQKNKNVSNEEEAKRILKAYKKVQQINFTQSQSSKKLQIKESNQNKNQLNSAYAAKVKQTLKELNSNKTKQYEKIIKPTSKKTIQNMQNKNQHEQRLKNKSIRKINDILSILINRKFKKSFDNLHGFYQEQIQNDLKMARKYRLFRIFSLWKDQTIYLKLQNQKIRKQEKKKQEEGVNLANQFRKFVVLKRILKVWYQTTIKQKKKRKYKREMEELQKKATDKQLKQAQNIKENILQNKLNGFLNGLKNKIQTKEKDRLKTIKQKTEESAGIIIPQASRQHQNQIQDQHHQLENSQINKGQQGSEINQQNQELQNQEQVADQQEQNHQKKHLSNQQLQQKRKQLQERSKNRKKMLQKLKKQKEDKKFKEEQQKQEIQKVIEQQQKKIKQQQYRQYLKNKQIQQEWEQRERILNQKAQQFNKLRIIKFYGFHFWKNLKKRQLQNVIQVKDTIQKILRKNLSRFIFERVLQNLEQKLELAYDVMRVKYLKKIKKKSFKGFQLQKDIQLQKKLQYSAFHQVHTRKIFFRSWMNIMQTLRLQNFEWQRPRIKKANDYHKVILLMKAIKVLKQNRIQCKKNKNIEQHKNKIKKKIQSIISEKIQINYDEFL